MVYYGGSGFSSRRDRTLVVDFSDSTDQSDLDGVLAVTTYTYACFKEGPGLKMLSRCLWLLFYVIYVSYRID